MRMYRINDIFYSLQGEGHNTGRAAVFIRFAGCNLRCPFCDTEFDSDRDMSAEEILAGIASLSPQHSQKPPLGEVGRGPVHPLIVLTGGEPTLQVDEAFVDLLHEHGYEVAMESNGTRPAPRNIDWLTVSPKIVGGEWRVKSGERLPDEVKVVFDEDTDPETLLPPPSTLHLLPQLFLQPCDTGNPQRNAEIVARCVAYIKEHPEWRLSLQTHKLIGIA